GADHAIAAVQRARHRGVKDVVDERALARARHARHTHEEPERERRAHAFQVVLARAHDREAAAAALPPLGGPPDREIAAEVAAGEARLRLLDLLRSPGGHHLAAAAPGPKSISQSASSIASWSCSTTTTVFPMSRRCLSASSSLRLSRWCSPIE